MLKYLLEMVKRSMKKITHDLPRFSCIFHNNLLPPQISQRFFSWGWNSVGEMNLEDIECFLEMGDALLHNKFSQFSSADISKFIRWGFISLLIKDFYPNDWEIFEKLLDTATEDQLIDLAAQISLTTNKFK